MQQRIDQPASPTDQQAISLSLREMAEVLVKHHNLHEGLYDLSFELQVAIGAVGPTPESALPGAAFGISRVGIKRAEKEGPHTVDAAKVNPAPRTSIKSTKKKAATSESS